MNDQQFEKIRSKAIAKYIKDNFTAIEKPKCSTCSTEQDVGYDTLADLYYCKKCLLSDLQNDTEAWLEYVTEREALNISHAGKI
jgi:late competence protein required for DNA uptake (superfamily II DNA/RNA helicase)